MPSTAAQPNTLDVTRIAPDVHSRYSPNLYKWLTKGKAKHRSWLSRVYKDKDGTLWIGNIDGGWFMGSQLMGVLCNGEKEGTAAYTSLILEEVVGFWDDYIAHGRCAIDPKHDQFFVGDESRWTVDGDKRTCQWCGKASQTLRRWTETVQEEAWETVHGVRD